MLELSNNRVLPLDVIERTLAHEKPTIASQPYRICWMQDEQ